MLLIRVVCRQEQQSGQWQLSDIGTHSVSHHIAIRISHRDPYPCAFCKSDGGANPGAHAFTVSGGGSQGRRVR